jgi:hypothetical protein
MNPDTIFQEARADGVTMSLSLAGTIKVNGDSPAVNRWVNPIKEHKAALVEILKAESERPPADVRAWRWLIHFADREPLTVSFSPEATHEEVLELYPDTVAAEPIAPDERTVGHLRPDEETTIRNWLVVIGETDPETVVEVLSGCRRDVDVRGYFLRRAGGALA